MVVCFFFTFFRILRPPFEHLAHKRGRVAPSIDIREHNPSQRWQLERFHAVVPFFIGRHEDREEGSRSELQSRVRRT